MKLLTGWGINKICRHWAFCSWWQSSWRMLHSNELQDKQSKDMYFRLAMAIFIPISNFVKTEMENLFQDEYFIKTLATFMLGSALALCPPGYFKIIPRNIPGTDQLWRNFAVYWWIIRKIQFSSVQSGLKTWNFKEYEIISYFHQKSSLQQLQTLIN